MKSFFLFALALLSAPVFSGAAEKLLDPALFDRDGSGTLDDAELKSYIAQRDGLRPDLSKLLRADLSFKADVKTKEDIEALFRQDVEEQALDKLGEMKAHLLPTRPPYPIELVRKYAAGETGADQGDEKPITKPGWFRAPKRTDRSSLGPFLLRRSPDDWSRSVRSADGATLAYADDQRNHRKTWAAEGALIYPVEFARDNTARDRASRIRSESWELLPSVSWKVLSVASSASADVQELQFSLPIVWSANLVSTGALRNSELALTPYALTDFRFGGLIAGGTLTWTPYLLTSDASFALNTGYKGLGTGPLLYQLGLVPLIDINHLYKTSRFIERDDDKSYFRVGGKASAGLRTKNFPSLELKASYQWFTRISGGPAESDLFSAAAKVWLNDNVALSFERQDGETPVARKDVDQSTLGLEMRF
jgi:hypothetical protein